MADAAMEPEKKDALLSQGAHEVRNAISVILGYGRMLSSERLGPITDSQRKAAVEIVNSAAKLKILADEMSQLSRLLAGGTTLTRTRVEVAPLIAAQIPAVPPALDGNIAIRVIDDAPAAAVSGDAGLLGQALNALMFAQRRELVSTDELCVAIDRSGGGDQPMIRVTIAGADRLAEVRRLSPSELEPLVELRGGLGFKLSIARHVIERHGGRSLSKTDRPRDSVPMLVGAVVILPQG
jgi:signal transduction histidine kinase